MEYSSPGMCYALRPHNSCPGRTVVIITREDTPASKRAGAVAHARRCDEGKRDSGDLQRSCYV